MSTSEAPAPRSLFYDEHGGQHNRELSDKVRLTMEEIAKFAHAPVNQCPSYFAFGPIYDLAAEAAIAAHDLALQREAQPPQEKTDGDWGIEGLREGYTPDWRLLLDLLRDIRFPIAASAQASHTMDGFTIVDGLPRSNRVERDEDRLLQRVDAAINLLEGKTARQPAGSSAVEAAIPLDESGYRWWCRDCSTWNCPDGTHETFMVPDALILALRQEQQQEIARLKADETPPFGNPCRLPAGHQGECRYE